MMSRRIHNKVPLVSKSPSDPLFQSGKKSLQEAIKKAQDLLLLHQFSDGYWWYTLEANETIGAEYILLREFLGNPDPKVHLALCQRILSQQRQDGSWAIFYNGPGDLSTTLECYWVLKLCGFSIHHQALKTAREFILAHGGPTQARVFTKIHLAMFGLAPWDSVPTMPYLLMSLPNWFPINIYEFSSWARACIVPLLVLLNDKPVHPLNIDLEELYPEMLANRSWKFPKQTSTFTLENGFLYLDKILKNLLKFPNPFKGTSSNQCIQYIREHIEKTEDIYPAMAYSALALKALGFSSQDATIQKCLKGLFNFQQLCEGDLPHIPRVQTKEEPLHATLYLHQQCCISPVWDTPWAGVSLLESGLNPEHPSLQKASDWLLKKQIKHVYGDWSIKNKKAKPGGWSFEFENDYFPDVDDTIEVLTLLYQTGLNSSEQKESFQLGLDWLLSMQSKNGGWAAFDVDNTLDLVNRIPFSDHGACLDPPTPDITGRMLEFLALIQFDKNSPVIKKAIQFIYKTQTSFGAWEGRWGVDYLYGTWCVLQGLAAIGENHQDSQILQAKDWLVKTQLPDGGWGESCLSYQQKQFVPLSASVPSQTAWATMGLLAVGEVDSVSVSRGIEFLLDRQNSHGCWDEKEYTGTGFPGHFYIRYHGYRHYFPLLALGKFQKRLNSCNS